MTYDIKFYSKKKADDRRRYYEKNPMFSTRGIDTNKIFFEIILEELNRKRGALRILDIGTGSGYVPGILSKLYPRNFNMIGVDFSKEMLDAATNHNKDPRIQFVLADNNKLPFKNNTFDIITNKLSTQFSINEVHRVLKRGGVFVFKEYGENKGFKEIKAIFKNRYRKTLRNPFEYTEELQNLGFSSISLNLFQIKRNYSLSDIESIFGMANLISGFDSKDLRKIKKTLFGSKKTIEITSDPFIISARKL